VHADLAQARADYERGDWRVALDRWSEADPAMLGASDLFAAAMAAYLTGHADAAGLVERAIDAYQAEGDTGGTVRAIFFLAKLLLQHGQSSLAVGWIARAERLADTLPPGAADRGWVSQLRVFAAYQSGAMADAEAHARTVTELGRANGEVNLIAFGLASQGAAAIYSGRVPEGLALLDESMTHAASGRLVPVLLGELYCFVIECCEEVSDLRRVAEWTELLSRWCTAHPELVPFTGQCSLHRGQVLAANGAWPQALDELTSAIDRYRAGGATHPIGRASAEKGDLQLAMGNFPAAEASYQVASEHGHDPQPGLAVLWLNRGALAAAVAAIRRLLAEITHPVGRCRVLPDAVTVLLAAGEVGDAREAARELEGIARSFGCEPLVARAALASGAVEVSVGDPAASLPYLRRARQLALQLEMPYLGGLAQLETARALRALGDDSSARRELAEAHHVFAMLGARPALDEVDRLLAPGVRPRGLSAREVEVLRLVAVGRSNAQIATQLVLSERTVARHLSNILAKLDVPSRTAAAAFAHDHQLV